ncbi:Neutral ceramidase B (N-CDase B) (NCDase B) (Acylsphingosine deacylase 2B) (N-acylsphingosine amidohydrolase 2B) [Durusdinium trenchii]|uniref:Neutral ceramidase n=1 Tax=Durusdinium trenchii TaxID=1381693 RepID=A0ABP0J524_9DINO
MLSWRMLAKIFVLLGVAGAEYHVGVGIADVTGPAAEVVMMGYADQDQRVTGIHMRLHARAFIFLDPEANKRMVYVAVDTWAATESLIQGLEGRLLMELPGLYSRHNVIIGPSHTHMGPAGTSPYYLYQVSSFGYVKQSTQALVDGMTEAVKMAHYNIRPAKVTMGLGPVDNTTVPGCPMPYCASRNRSPTSYLHNPEEERANYSSNMDYDMDLIKIVDAKTGEPMGTMNWFAVHATSMKSSSGLISGDNKGYAQYLFEKAINGPSSVRPAGRGPFIAGFGAGAAGDISPNTYGSWCQDGKSCETAQSVCYDHRGKPSNGECNAYGPGGGDILHSTKVIGERQYLAARHIFDGADRSIGRGVDYRTRYVDLTQYYFKYEDGRPGRTCPPAMSTTFAAGTTDGPSHVDEFGQNMTPTNGFLRFLGHLITLPPAEAKSCHAPKDILLYTGSMKAPYPYMPSRMAFQLLRIGDLIIAGVPGEFTTMAGRRTAKAIKKPLVEKGVVSPDARVVINNCASGYAGYVTTIEEYQHQRYEGGSTAYGPHTHGAMTNILREMAEEMAEGKVYRWPGAVPKIPTQDQMMEGQTDVVADDPPIGGKFGDVKTDVRGMYAPGHRVQATIWGAHPRNNLRRNSSFVSVWRLKDDGKTWHMVADDNDWELRFEWKRVGISASTVTITWEIPKDCPHGSYSLYYSGEAKHRSSIIKIEGHTRTFQVSNKTSYPYYDVPDVNMTERMRRTEQPTS